MYKECAKFYSFTFYVGGSVLQEMVDCMPVETGYPVWQPPSHKQKSSRSVVCLALLPILSAKHQSVLDCRSLMLWTFVFAFVFSIIIFKNAELCIFLILNLIFLKYVSIPMFYRLWDAYRTSLERCPKRWKMSMSENVKVCLSNIKIL